MRTVNAPAGDIRVSQCTFFLVYFARSVMILYTMYIIVHIMVSAMISVISTRTTILHVSRQSPSSLIAQDVTLNDKTASVLSSILETRFRLFTIVCSMLIQEVHL